MRRLKVIIILLILATAATFSIQGMVGSNKANIAGFDVDGPGRASDNLIETPMNILHLGSFGNLIKQKTPLRGLLETGFFVEISALISLLGKVKRRFLL